MITLIMYSCINSRDIDFTFPRSRPYLHSGKPGFTVLRVLTEIRIEISMHIIESNFKRTVRTSRHP